MSNKIYIGIDVGKKGAIVKLHPDGKVEKTVIPLINKEIDQKALVELITTIGGESFYHAGIHIVIEDVHSIFGTSAKSNFQFGRCLGLLEGMVTALKYPHSKVQPKIWQKVCFEGVAAITKPGSRAKGRGAYDNKAMALIAAQNLYPSLDLRKSERAKIPHDGIVDALLMAHYAKVKNL